MEKFFKEVRNITNAIEELAGMIVDNPNIEEWFAEMYGENAILDNPVWYVADYIKGLVAED